MITATKTDLLQLLTPPELTARLAMQAARTGKSTVEAALDLLIRQLDAIDPPSVRRPKTGRSAA